MDKSILMKRIEQCRAEMITLSNSHPLTSEVVVRTSMKLDKLINEYQNNNMPNAS